MPELPEVETVRRTLLPYLPGRQVQRVVVRDPMVVKDPRPELLARRLEGETFRSLERVGKYLILKLDREGLLIHLGMTGQLTFRHPDRRDTPFLVQSTTGLQRALQHPVDKHTHVTLELSDGTAVHYRDIRKFGKWRLYRLEELPGCPQLSRLGPDPLTPDFTLAGFEHRLKRTRRAVKAALLDQSLVAGLGNIYVDEVLFLAGIRPTRTAHLLSRRSVRTLFEAIPEVLRIGIADGGTTFSDYLDGEGNPGTHQERLQVYGRYGLECRRCGSELLRDTIAQRTTTWCRRCQS
ncbi:MAG: bifunctional DNA-formamidopyrimidine glycosylase/DNA-(apurinic or apyrimidinic site) lyase [Armatimonadetes bacterium]|nr:bifunctional DNA-formamidopyrimidine glycosylase/DNA-(apurinic or apyrimidinic site) lyase [Armatimonadota bacterium]